MRRRPRSTRTLIPLLLALLAATPAGAPAAEPDSRAAQAATPTSPNPGAAPSSAQPPAQPEEDEAERLARAALERTLIARGGLLLRPWSLEIEPSLTYFHSSSDRIVIDAFTIFPVLAVGTIRNEQIRRDIIQPSLSARLGLPLGFQTDVRVPYRFELERKAREENNTVIEDNREGEGLGDVELGLSYQLLRERGWVPDLLVGFRVKTATGDDPFEVNLDTDLPRGTGFWGFQGTLTAVKVRDPIVLFYGFSYTANLAADKVLTDGTVHRVDPGNTWGVSAGLGLALNLETSINFSFEERYTVRSTRDGEDLAGSYANVGVFKVGASYTPSPRISVDVGLGIGLTRDAPDLQLTVAVPFRVRR